MRPKSKNNYSRIITREGKVGEIKKDNSSFKI